MFKVSIIIPIYNVEKHLSKCLDSITIQTLCDIEVILVNDGSPDNCKKICDEYAVKDSRIKVVHKSNGGVSSARNTGIDVATGEYIGFVDPDDYIEPEMYEFLYCTARLNNADICRTNAYFKENAGNKRKIENFDDKSINSIDYVCRMIAPSTLAKADDLIIGSVWCSIYKRQFIIDNKIRFNENQIMSEDLMFNLYAAIATERIAICNGCFYHYVFNPMSAINRYSKDHQMVHSKLDNELSRFLNKYKLTQIVNERLVVLKILRTISRTVNECKPGNPKTFWKKIKEIQRIVSETDISQAAKRVNKNGLYLRKRVVLFCIEHKLAFPLWIYYSFAVRRLA